MLKGTALKITAFWMNIKGTVCQFYKNLIMSLLGSWTKNLNSFQTYEGPSRGLNFLNLFMIRIDKKKFDYHSMIPVLKAYN